MNINSNLISREKIKEILIEKTADRVGKTKDEVFKVIDFVFKDAAQALHKHNSVEISGFGIFKVSQGKLRKEAKKSEINYNAYMKSEKFEEGSPLHKFLEQKHLELQTKMDELEKHRLKGNTGRSK